MAENPVLAIGDVQGKTDRLEALLLQEGIIGPCGVCGGSGDVSASEKDALEFCPACKGSGTARIRHDVTVVQTGDVIDATWQSQTADSVTIAFADAWVDVLLWGNHDRPVVDNRPDILFGGYASPLPEVLRRIKLMEHQGRFRMAYAAHGFLLVHAGVHSIFGHEGFRLPAVLDRTDPVAVADYFNGCDLETRGGQWAFATPDGTSYEVTDEQIEDFIRLRDSIGFERGGRNEFGGLLWRDARDGLYTGLRQVFGHSSAELVRSFGPDDSPSYCIDLEKFNNVGGIWLPEERVVKVDLLIRATQHAG